MGEGRASEATIHNTVRGTMAVETLRVGESGREGKGMLRGLKGEER
jgi:hypothetical protein